MALTSEIRSRTWQKWIRPAAIEDTACQDVGGLASPETPRAVLVRTAPDPTRVIADGELSPACPAAICWGGGGGGAAAAVLLRPERPAPGSWLGGPSGPALVRYTFNDAPIVNRSAMQIGTFNR